MVEVKNLSRQFGTFTAVDNISFQVQQGEVLGFLGPNGAGKSTSMKMITGFLAPSAGTAIINGFDIINKPLQAKREIGYLPEGAPAYPDMTVVDFLEFIAEIRNFSGTEKSKRVDSVIERVSLESVRYQLIDTLSKGFKRRVGLAQAILHDPKVLIMDEPTDGLDPNQKHEVRSLIQDMAQEKVIILSTHILEEVHAVCSRAIIIANGRLIADDTPAALEARAPNHNAVTLTLPAEQQNAASIRESLQGIAHIKELKVLEENDDWFSYLLLPKRDQSIVNQVSQIAHQQQWTIKELSVARGQLDEVFRQLTV
ncbi:ABC transporter ATP-binding protein [Candidatus Venteria ishoeyi]|uniref:Putative ABC transporter ATP-binding protein YbhF n=1 Tax=Candidatus Venteria ishoeyi TaxID=1899563 RepID=A0A1H6F7X3_9GAMM|nr:ABC transporter ATP-binding protein [Candidatus Venteria ishoeyi]SEH05663.1 putative ABC transporter ATP-binding protein YbhF [Candidatus Venteria ishoeyi]